MKISALTAATTPLSGAELFPIVQSGNTRRVSLNDLLRSIGNGTAAAPALAPGGDPNTGIYFPAADTIGFVEGGVEVMRLTSAGDLRLTSSAAPFLYAGPSGAVESGFQLDVLNQRIEFYTAGALRWRVSQSGHFLAGTDNSFDIGVSGANRPRDLFLGRNAAVAGNVSVGATALSVSNNYGTPQLGTTSDVYSTFHVESHHNTAGNYSFIGLMRSRGTRAAPTHVQSGDPIGIVTAQVYNDAGSFPYREAASIQFVASGNHAAGSLPADILFRTTPSGSNAPIDRMRLDASGNLGLGVTPNAGWAVGKVLQIGSATGAFHYGAGGQLISGVNAYYDTDWRYVSANQATYYQQSTGRHQWYTAPSGTAGATISFTQAMTLDASGNLGIGTTSPAMRLHVEGATNATAQILLRNTNGAATAVARMVFGNDVNSLGGLDYTSSTFTGSPNAMRYFGDSQIWYTIAGVERWRINNSGHLLAGADNSYDIGASGATRPRDLHLGRNLVGAGWVRAGAASAGAASTTTIGGTTATTVGAAGAASALPANPLGYIVAHVGTTEVRIPYYNA